MYLFVGGLFTRRLLSRWAGGVINAKKPLAGLYNALEGMGLLCFWCNDIHAHGANNFVIFHWIKFKIG